MNPLSGFANIIRALFANPLSGFANIIRALFAPRAYEAWDYDSLRWHSAKRCGCTCTSLSLMDSWSGPYCPTHRPWPQARPRTA